MATENPFDLSKYFKDFDPTKAVEEFTSKLKAYKLPGVDLDAVIASQKKNVEALTAANKVAIEGLQSVAKRQGEILQETMQEVSKAVKDLSSAGGPQQVAVKQAELAKSAFEKALGNMKELAEMVAKAQQEATSTINARIAASLDELKSAAEKLKA